MCSRLISRFTLPLALLSAISPALSHAAVKDRITAATVSNSGRVPLQGNLSARVKRSADLGSVAQAQKMDSITLRFSLTADQQVALNQLQAAQLNPSSPSYHQWLTPEQFGASFGLSSTDMAKVSTWLTTQGFTITNVSRSSTFISFSGTAAQVQQAFGTPIHNFSYNGKQYLSNTTDPVLPAAISGVVSSISGLNTYKLAPHLSRPRTVSGNPSQPAYTQTINGTTSHYISPADLYTIYDYAPLNSASTPINGTGITIAVMGQTDIVPANIAAFRTAAGLPAINLTQKLNPSSGDPGVSEPDIDEAHLDIEWSGASAPGASILYVFSSPQTGAGAFDALTYTIDSKLAPIVSISYGGCESLFGPSVLASYNLLLQQANIQGMTIVSASGDTGATDCDVANLATEGLNVDFPGSSPYVTSAGGNMFSGDLSTPATYWSSNNGSTGGSATQYIPEQPWNETNATQGLDAGGAGGGGASAFFAKPAWQTGAGVPTDGSRDVPDFSLNAAANHDGYMVCSSGDGSNNDLPCSSGFLTSSGQPNVFGGTSFVAPIFAGILARVEQKLNTGSTGIGNVGPVLYGLANIANVYHDVTSGNNSIECVQGTLNCPTGGAIGYTAGVGYDQASGLGSIDVANLVNNWSVAVPTSSIVGAASAVGSTTTVATTAQLCGVNPGTLSLTVTVASAAATARYPGQPASSATPTGTVQILVDNAPFGSPQQLPANGVLSISNLTSLSSKAIASGGHVISASYSGDATFAGSKGTLLGPANNTADYPSGPQASIDFVSTTSADFSITPCSATTSVAPSATSPAITFTVTPVNGFTGAVNFTVTNSDGMAATPSFTVQPVNITGASGATTAFTVVASEVTTAAHDVAPRPANRNPSSGQTPWYAAGSGATLACVFLLVLPKRRRWGALLAVILSVAALTTVGCSNNTVSAPGSGSGGGGTGPTNPTTPASPGTYTFIITGVSGALVHSIPVTITVP